MTDRPDQPATSVAQPKPAQRRKPRWWLRIPLVLLALLLLAAGVTQVILKTDLPRRIVLKELQQETGLRIAADSLATGWLGRTTLYNVTVALPLGSEPFARVPRVRVRHSHLLAILLDLPLRISEIEITHPDVKLIQGTGGRWNVQEAIDLLVARRGAGGGGGGGGAEFIELPRIRVDAATIHVADIAGRAATFRPLDLRGEPDDRLAWSFGATLGPHLTVSGQVAPNQNWAHRVSLTGHHLGEALRPWTAGVPRPVHFRGVWQGQVNGPEIAGRLRLDEAQLAEFHLAGAVGLSASPDAAQVSPESFRVTSARLPSPVELTSGVIRVRGEEVDLQALRFILAGGAAQVGGRLNWLNQNAAVDVAWTDISLPDGITHAGTLEASVERALGGGPRLRAKLISRGRAGQDRWEGELSLSGQGPSWQSLNLQATLASLDVQGAASASLRDVQMRLRLEETLLRLSSIQLGQTNRLQGNGEFDLKSRRWQAWASLKDQPVPRSPEPVSVELSASGAGQRVDLKNLELRSGSLRASAQGDYVPGRPQPLELSLAAWRSAFAITDPRAGRLLTGGLRADARISGAVQPLNLRVEGKLLGQNLAVAGRTIGDVQVEVTGAMDRERATIRSSELRLLEGMWSLSAGYRYAGQRARIALAVVDLPLKQLDGLVEPAPQLQGTLRADLGGEWRVGAQALPAISGEWAIQDLSRGPLAVDRAAGRLSVEDDVLLIDGIDLLRREGTGGGSIRINLRDRSTIHAKLRMRDWPVEASAAEASGQFSLDADLTASVQKRTLLGEISAEGKASYQGKPATTFNARANLAGRRIDLARFELRTLDGTADGSATVLLDDWTRSTGAVRLEGLRPSSLAAWFPIPTELQGTWSGTLSAGPDTSSHPIEPFRVELNLQPKDARYGELAIGPITGTLAIGDGRLVLTQSAIALADGEAALWGRVTRHGKEWLVHTQVDFDRLSLNQLVRAAKPDAEEMLGRLRGRLTAYGNPRWPKRLSGELLVNISESDLANSDIIGAMYQAMSVQAATKEPVGEGSARLRLQDGGLVVRNGIYRNRGIEIRASISVADVFEGIGSPISGYAVGTARPLYDLKLPLARDLDDILSALQSSATTLRIDGTIADPRVRQATLSEIGAEFKQLLVGDAKRQP